MVVVVVDDDDDDDDSCQMSSHSIKRFHTPHHPQHMQGLS